MLFSPTLACNNLLRLKLATNKAKNAKIDYPHGNWPQAILKRLGGMRKLHFLFFRMEALVTRCYTGGQDNRLTTITITMHPFSQHLENTEFSISACVTLSPFQHLIVLPAFESAQQQPSPGVQ